MKGRWNLFSVLFCTKGATELKQNSPWKAFFTKFSLKRFYLRRSKDFIIWLNSLIEQKWLGQHLQKKSGTRGKRVSNYEHHTLGAELAGGMGRSALSFFEKRKKSLDFAKKCPNCGHLSLQDLSSMQRRWNVFQSAIMPRKLPCPEICSCVPAPTVFFKQKLIIDLNNDFSPGIFQQTAIFLSANWLHYGLLSKRRY